MIVSFIKQDMIDCSECIFDSETSEDEWEHHKTTE